MATSISSVLILCLKLFNGLISREDIFSLEAEIPKSLWHDELGRLRIWAGNIGAHQFGQSSLDYRLRDASHIKVQVIRLLERLRRTLEDLEELSNEDLMETHSQASGSDETSEVRQIYDGLVDTINCLYQMSMLIRRPAQHDRMLGTRKADALSYEPYDREHVRAKYPHAKSLVAERLGNAISRRRANLKYRERHHAKMKKGISMGITDGASTIYSETVATDLEEPNIQFDEAASYAGVSQTSYANTLIQGHNTMTIPPPPKGSKSEKPFECPYCFFIVTIKDRNTWARHVFKDLMPYLCVFPECSTPNRLYDSRRDWYQHLKRNHLKSSSLELYDCALCEETRLTETGLERHLGRHLEELALFAIPRPHDDDLLDSDESRRSNAQDANSSGDADDDSNNDDEELEKPIQMQCMGETKAQCSCCRREIVKMEVCYGCRTCTNAFCDSCFRRGENCVRIGHGAVKKNRAKIMCDACDQPIVVDYYQCTICNDDDFDLCIPCVDKGKKCLGSNHRLRRITIESGSRVASNAAPEVPDLGGAHEDSLEDGSNQNQILDDAMTREDILNRFFKASQDAHEGEDDDTGDVSNLMANSRLGITQGTRRGSLTSFGLRSEGTDVVSEFAPVNSTRSGQIIDSTKPSPPSEEAAGNFAGELTTALEDLAGDDDDAVLLMHSEARNSKNDIDFFDENREKRAYSGSEKNDEMVPATGGPLVRSQEEGEYSYTGPREQFDRDYPTQPSPGHASYSRRDSTDGASYFKDLPAMRSLDDSDMPYLGLKVEDYDYGDLLSKKRSSLRHDRDTKFVEEPTEIESSAKADQAVDVSESQRSSEKKDLESQPKSILKPARQVPFPEDPEHLREGVAPLKGTIKDKGIPHGARWTKIARALVNPAALEAARERFEERDDYVIVLRVLSKEEIQKLAERTHEIRRTRDLETSRATYANAKAVAVEEPGETKESDP